MAKQSCDPFRGRENGQAIGVVKPGVAVEKGDLMAREPTNKAWVVPFSSVSTVALAHTNFVGVANGSVAADDVQRRLVINTLGRYMFPLVTDAEVRMGDYVIPVLNAGSTACRAQEWNVSTTGTYAIGTVSKNMPDYDDFWPETDADFVLRAAVTGEQDSPSDEWTITGGEIELAAGDLIRLMLTSGTIANAVDGDIVRVLTAEGSDVYTLENLAETAITISADAAGFFEVVRGSRVADEAEAVISSTLFHNV